MRDRKYTVKTQLEVEDIQEITAAVLDTLKPLLAVKGLVEIQPQDRHFNVKQLSEYMGMSAQWIYNNMRTIPHFNLNRKPLFRKSEIDTWIEQYRVKTETDNLPEPVKPVINNKKARAGVGCFKQRRP